MTPLTICTPNWTIAESYGRIANELRNGLLARGYYVNTLGVDAPERHFELCFGGIFLSYPTQYSDYSALAYNGSKVAITMFESTELPKGWAAELNKCKAVIVPSKWCKETFVREGVKVPVHVIPLGISEAYKFTERPIEVDDDYVHRFISIGFANDRKGYYELCRGFYLAFGDDPKYHLTFKNRKVDSSNVKSFSAANMDMVRADLTDDQMNQMYANFDYMVFPSHGEGFGLPPREFACTGGIALATDWSGLSDDIDVWGVKLRTRGLETAFSSHAAGEDIRNVGTWAKVDEGDIADALINLTINRDYYMRQSLERAKATRQLYSWDSFVDRVLQVWNEVS